MGEARTDTNEAPEGASPSRRDVMALSVGAAAGVLSLFPQEAAAEAVMMPATTQDEGFMREAIALAAKADFPFGAVITRGDEVLSRGLNMGRRLADPTAHGEMVAIRRFLAVRSPEELRGTTLYTSGEPCAMCMGAIIWCGISRVVFAASVAQLSKVIHQIDITGQDLAQRTPFEKIEITGGVLAPEALALFDKK